MDNREIRIRTELSEILASKEPPNRKRFIRDINDFLYTENRKISDMEMEASLREKEQHVYSRF
ncbi:MAG: hypothetical protein V3V33_12545 [Candidatus Lokiarchaeia archaeon]